MWRFLLASRRGPALRASGLEARPWNAGCLLAPARDQKASELTISPPALVPRAHHVIIAMLLLTNFTLPSAIATLTPPGCMLVALWYPVKTAPQPEPQSIRQSAQGYVVEFGGT